MDKVNEADRVVQEAKLQLRREQMDWSARCLQHGEAVARGMQLLAKQRLQEAQEVQQHVLTTFKPSWLPPSQLSAVVTDL
jgi:hypothetical protein